ncbi:hypothetical protein ACFW2Y_13290 [Streptomyces sp. NPDC058877]|uniref:hypothetical protein n=1 Tax=unclassified Streptomyces TaxID=2593676 RepID=UPI003691D0EB
MIVLQPVLEVHASDDFDLWPVADITAYGFLPLSGALTPEQVGTAVKRIAECNDIDPEVDDRPARPDEPLGSLLHGLLTMDHLFAAGGLRVTDTATGITLLPGCCSGLGERRDWLGLLDGDGCASFGHDPSPLAERFGGTVRLTVDAEQDDGPVIELSPSRWGDLLDGAEHDLNDFLGLVASWAERQLPEHRGSVVPAIARALDLPAPPTA